MSFRTDKTRRERAASTREAGLRAIAAMSGVDLRANPAMAEFIAAETGGEDRAAWLSLVIAMEANMIAGESAWRDAGQDPKAMRRWTDFLYQARRRNQSLNSAVLVAVYECRVRIQQQVAARHANTTMAMAAIGERGNQS